MWSAWADELISVGSEIRVKEREGLVLKVERFEEVDQDTEEGDE
jgi:membrane-bound ClpP family serine protease